MLQVDRAVSAVDRLISQLVPVAEDSEGEEALTQPSQLSLLPLGRRPPAAAAAAAANRLQQGSQQQGLQAAAAPKPAQAQAGPFTATATAAAVAPPPSAAAVATAVTAAPQQPVVEKADKPQPARRGKSKAGASQDVGPSEPAAAPKPATGGWVTMC